MTGARMSALPVAQYCGQAAALSEKYGAGRAAAMSSFFHAVQAKSPNVNALAAKLTPEELEEVGQWHPIETIELYDGEIVLDYASADKELEVMLDDQGEHTYVAEKAITIGHLDCAWQRHYRNLNVVFVQDIKRSEWTVTDPHSLQILAYGWAYAKKLGADAFVPGIWAAVEGKHIWGDWFDMNDLDSLDLWDRIRHAALNTDQAATGPHCRNCWARLHCPEFLFPVHDRMNAMAAFAEGVEPTREQVADAYLAAQAMKDISDALKERVKEWSRRCGEVVAADGRRLVMSERQGRETVSVASLRKEAPELADKLVKRGEPFVVPMWK